MKGIILAGGSGTRLHPITLGLSKQLLPVYNKPMIYYPLSILLLAGLRDILVITTPHDQENFRRLLGDGSELGLNFSYASQSHPRGLADAFILGKQFIGNDTVCMVLGDNIFFGNHLCPMLEEAAGLQEGARVFGYRVKDPQRYGVAELNDDGLVIDIVEKPRHPKSNIAVTGLYFYDNDVVAISEGLRPSARGELEITDVNKAYIAAGKMKINVMGRGFAWLDAGTYGSLMQASQYVQVLEEREGLCIASLEEIAFRQGFIDREQLLRLSHKLGNSPYGAYLCDIAHATHEEPIYAN